MPSQIMGYYSARKEKLLKDFDGTSALMQASLVARCGKEFTSTRQSEVRQEYEKLIPEIPQWKRWLLRRFMFSCLVRKIMARRARQQQKVCFGDFEVEYLIGGGDEFDFGVNYLQCGNLTFMKRHGGEEFAPYVCMSDIVLSEAMGRGLIRTQTLADGCPIVISG